MGLNKVSMCCQIACLSPRRGDMMRHQCEIWRGGTDRRSAIPRQVSTWSVAGWIIGPYILRILKIHSPRMSWVIHTNERHYASFIFVIWYFLLNR